MQINPYITLPGTGNVALELYQKVFGVQSTDISRFKDMPAGGGMPAVSAEGGERILHASLTIGGNMLMLSDAPEGMDADTVAGNEVHISVHPDSREDADRMFALLSEGGTVSMPMADAFWGDYFGMCTDKFGVRWMFNYSAKK